MALINCCVGNLDFCANEVGKYISFSSSKSKPTHLENHALHLMYGLHKNACQSHSNSCYSILLGIRAAGSLSLSHELILFFSMRLNPLQLSWWVKNEEWSAFLSFFPCLFIFSHGVVAQLHHHCCSAHLSTRIQQHSHRTWKLGIYDSMHWLLIPLLF